jgi:metacaspase-1
LLTILKILINFFFILKILEKTKIIYFIIIMSSILQNYKINELKKLDEQFKIDSNNLLTFYRNRIQEIGNTVSYTMAMAYAYIAEAIINYNKELLVLKNKLNSDKAKINNLTSIPDNTPPTVPPTTVPPTVPPIVPPPIISLPSSRKRALLIGINYRNSQRPLYGCINDAYSLERKLRSAYGFKNVSLLTDDTVIKPTAKNIYYQIQALLESGVSGDLLFLSYSGHGSYIIDTSGDEKDGNDEMIIGIDIIGVRDDELKTLINTYLKPGVTLIMLCDSCYSGTILDLKYQYFDTQNNIPVNINNVVNETLGNVILISGGQDNQTTADAYINNTYQGATTWAFLSTLDKTSKPTWTSLISNMRTLTKNSGFSQIAQICSGKPLDINSQIVL